MIMENLKRIMSEKKTRLTLLRNQDWKTVKSGTEKSNSTGNEDKQSTIINKKDKTERERWNILGRKKNSTGKTKITTRGNKPEGPGEKKKTKTVSRQDKTMQTKQDIPKQLASRRWMHQHIQTHRMTKKRNNFGAKYGNVD